MNGLVSPGKTRRRPPRGAWFVHVCSGTQILFSEKALLIHYINIQTTTSEERNWKTDLRGVVRHIVIGQPPTRTSVITIPGMYFLIYTHQQYLECSTLYTSYFTKVNRMLSDIQGHAQQVPSTTTSP